VLRRERECMLVSTKGRYALRLMVYLGQSPKEIPISLSEIALDEDISVKFLEQICRPLVQAGLIKSIRGQKGGYLLARDAADISVAEILRAAEGDESLVGCNAMRSGSCPREEMCSTVQFWRGLDSVIDEYCQAYSLNQLCE